MTLKSSNVECNNCGSTDLSWHGHIAGRKGSSHTTTGGHIVFELACEDCSTVRQQLSLERVEEVLDHLGWIAP